MLTFDHIVIAAETLEAGVAHVSDRLGVQIPFGGNHPLMGTHNHLMQLGNEAFLEVISIDPATPTERTRWYGLDAFEGPPRLHHWVARVDNMKDAAGLDVDVGEPLDVTRGRLYWQLTVRDDGTMPFEGAFPSIIDWPQEVFPVPNMADLGCALATFLIRHPRSDALKSALAPHLGDPRVKIEQGETVELIAEIMTPTGLRRI